MLDRLDSSQASLSSFQWGMTRGSSCTISIPHRYGGTFCAVERVMNLGHLVPAKAKEEGSEVSHILYADDELVFAKVDCNYKRAVTCIFEEFACFLGLELNLKKN